MKPNPFEQVPQLQPTMVQAAEFVRLIFGRAGLDMTRLVIAFEVEHKDLDGPLRQVASWPVGEMDKHSELIREAETVLRAAHVAGQAKGQG